ncbi:MAG: MoxR family ATPase [Gammaproteobacteria bacterium]|nr:MAG: MoxR family ATPase [Gammaproteobacteria bacterium]
MGFDSQEHGEFAEAGRRTNELLDEIGKVVIGQDEIVRQVLICLLAGGHVLIEGVPGLGKTLLVRALAQCFGGESRRIQFTPDLMPSDVTGHAIFNMQQQSFEVRKGPVFTNLLLADEINRAPAKTQAALLEVMQERQVTIEGESYAVTEPFMVLATQNPIEQDGTYPLPEAQLDRFMMKTLMDYPTESAEMEIVQKRTQKRIGDDLQTDELGQDLDLGKEDVIALREVCAHVAVDEAVQGYAVRITRETRSRVGMLQGASPRASIALVRAARANAVLEGRHFVIPDDVKRLAKPVLRHRIHLTPDLEIEGATPDRVLDELLDVVDAPRL